MLMLSKTFEPADITVTRHLAIKPSWSKNKAKHIKTKSIGTPNRELKGMRQWVPGIMHSLPPHSQVMEEKHTLTTQSHIHTYLMYK